MAPLRSWRVARWLRAGLAGVEYGTGGKANPASLVRSISRLPPGPGYKILDILSGIAQEKRLERIYRDCTYRKQKEVVSLLQVSFQGRATA